jgi:ABC-2 type transport system ATP-binding protein
MLVGLLLPTGGQVRVLGAAIPGEVEKLRSKVGYMTQKFSLYEDLSIEENLEFAAEIFGLGGAARKRRIQQVINEFGLGERKEQRRSSQRNLKTKGSGLNWRKVRNPTWKMSSWH